MLLFKFPFGPLQTNALLVACAKTKKCAVIDPSPGSTGALLHKAEKLGLQIEQIFLTHSHWDHFADAWELKMKTKAPLSVHPLDQENLRFPGSDGIPVFVPVQAVAPDHFFNEGNTLIIGDLYFQVLHTPGHSPGSVCFYCVQKRLLISGDTLFQGAHGSLSLPTAQPELMGASLAKLATLPPETKVVPGHGPDTSIGEESWLTPFKIHNPGASS